jgi:hypothetical protein
MMGRRHMARLYAFAGWAGLAVAVAIAALTLPLADANATSDDEQASSSLEFNEKDGTLSIEWSGPTVPGHGGLSAHRAR